jgi:hypothetical protein
MVRFQPLPLDRDRPVLWQLLNLCGSLDGKPIAALQR